MRRAPVYSRRTCSERSDLEGAVSMSKQRRCVDTVPTCLLEGLRYINRIGSRSSREDMSLPFSTVMDLGTKAVYEKKILKALERWNLYHLRKGLVLKITDVQLSDSTRMKRLTRSTISAGCKKVRE